MKKIVDCVLLAAGLSTRMGEFKPLLKFNGFTFIENIINKTIEYTNSIYIVTGYNNNLIEYIINTKYPNKNIFLVYNENYNSGMYQSLLTGLSKIEDEHYCLYHFVDQPTIPTSFYKNFILQIDEYSDIIQPVYNGKKGHPLIFSFNFVKYLLNSKIDSNLKDEIKKFSKTIKYWKCDYPQVLKDFDTKEDYLLIEGSK